MSKTSNGCKKATRLPKSDESFRATPNTVVTIDFGTTHCSVSYLTSVNSHPNPRTMDPILLKIDDQGRKRVPSCILFDQFGVKKAFGYQARSVYASVTKSLRPSYAYFEHVKKDFQRDKNVDRNRKIKASNGKAYFLVDVIAHILCHLKGKVIKELHDFGFRNVKSADIDWVITVPAIWRARGKKMMREAGYKAGLCTSEVELGELKVADGPQLLAAIEAHPEKLSLALEPESASIECLKAFEREKDNEKFCVAVENYLIVDCGGGTVDIATHGIIGKNVCELASAEGNFQGGTTVNEEFKTFLSDFVDDPSFEKYLRTEDEVTQSQRVADINKLVYTTFEEQKMIFGDVECRDNYLIEFPNSFARTFAGTMEKKAEGLDNTDVQIEDEGWHMRLSSTKMAQFFSPCIRKIGSLLVRHLRQKNLVNTIDTVFWVGGFGGSEYLRLQLQKILLDEFPSRKFQYCTPPEPQLAVIRGASAFRCDPGIIQQRRSDATYGIACRIPFQKGIHRLDFCVDDGEDSEKKWCDNIFSTFVEKNESVCTNEVFVASYSPSTSYQKVAPITLYCAPHNDVWYTNEDGVTELASMKVNIAGYGRDRKIEIVFDITHTEIQVCARDKQTHEEVKMVVDFLSSTK